MNRRCFLPLLLALLLTGCSGQTDSTAPTEPMTETEAETEALTEAPTEAPVDDPEEAAYAFIRETLVPRYGLSKPWTPVQPITYTETGFTCEDLPAETQGLISAVVQDFDGNGEPEIVTLMLKEHSFILDLYCPFDGTYALSDVYPFLTYWDNVSYNPKLRIQDDLLLLTNYPLTCDPAHEQDAAFTAMCQDLYLGDMPDVACVSAELTVLRVVGDDFKEQAVIRNSLTPGKETFSANGEEITCAVGEMDYGKTKSLVSKALNDAGVQFDPGSLYTDWYSSEPHDGLSIDFTNAEPVFEINHGNQTLFTDYTDLDDHIS